VGSAAPSRSALTDPGSSNPGPPGLRTLVVKGLRWKVASQAILQIVSFASTLVLARLLSPRDFGLAGLAIVFAGLVFLLADFGLGASIVQRAELTEEDRSTAFWTTAALGVFLTLAGVGLSWPLADLYRQPDVQPLVAVLSVTFLFTALTSTQGALLIRSLAFRSLELRTIVSTVLSVTVGIVLAALGYGAWAIIAQIVANSGVSTVLLWRSSPWRPRLVYSVDSLRGLMGYGGWIFAGGFIRYFERNVDNFLIGRFRGPAALGTYGIAYNIALIPILKIVIPVQQVFFPALSRIEEPRAAGALWLRMSRILAAVSAPALVGVAVVAPDFVVVVLGEKWRAAIHVLQILAWVGLVQAGAAQTTTLLQALGRTGIFFRYTLMSAICSIAGFAIGLHWGIVGVAMGYAIVNTVLIPWYIASGATAVGLPLRDLGRAISGVVQATAGMALVVVGLRLALLDHLSAGPRLVVLIAAGIAVYVPLCRSRAPEVVDEIRRARISRFTEPEVAGPL
jgi:O-antigen/teichoic acid export membrane protein